MVTGCRSSGVLTASALIVQGQSKLVSIHATAIGQPTTIKVFDGTDNTGKEVARIVLGQPDLTLEFDMHGVLCRNGIFLEEVSGAMACSVEYA